MGLVVGKGDGSFVGGGVEPPFDVVGFGVLRHDDSSNAIVRGLFPPLYLPLELVLPASVVFVAETTLTWISASVIQLVLSPSTLTL